MYKNKTYQNEICNFVAEKTAHFIIINDNCNHIHDEHDNVGLLLFDRFIFKFGVVCLSISLDLKIARFSPPKIKIYSYINLRI